MANARNKKRGVTYVEVSIYIGVLAMVLTVVIASIVAVVRSYRTFAQSRDINQSALVSLNSMSRVIRDAQILDLISSDLNATTSLIVFIGGDRIYVQNGALKLKEDSTTQTLTEKTIRVDDFNAIHIVSTSTEALKIDLTLSASTSDPNARSETFYMFTVLRGSY